MNRNDTLLIKKITNEYLSFMKRTKSLVQETKRATTIALKKILKLQDGDQVLINDDGSFEIVDINCKEDIMTEDKNRDSDKLTLNGREVTADELKRQKEAAELQKGAKLEELSKGNFRIRLND